MSRAIYLDKHKEKHTMPKITAISKVTKEQIFRAVASSTAIETGMAVQKIEQSLKRNQAQAKVIGLAR